MKLTRTIILDIEEQKREEKEKRRAVRCRKMKESGIRQFIIPRLSNFSASCLSKWKSLRFWFLVKRMDLTMSWQDFKKELDRVRYCKEGYHKLIKQRHAIERVCKKRTYKMDVQYIECSTCRWKFFTTAKEKRKFQRMTSSHRNSMKKWFKSFGGNEKMTEEFTNRGFKIVEIEDSIAPYFSYKEGKYEICIKPLFGRAWHVALYESENLIGSKVTCENIESAAKQGTKFKEKIKELLK